MAAVLCFSLRPGGKPGKIIFVFLTTFAEQTNLDPGSNKHDLRGPSCSGIRLQPVSVLAPRGPGGRF